MTSFLIEAHKGRMLPRSWEQHPDCPFCRIIRGDAPAFVVHESDKVIAVLDILPLRKGHTLVIPKVHCSRVSELPSEYAAAAGVAISHVSNALTQALEHTALNVVCNQEYAQAVPHVHYHIIPAPRFDSGSSDGSHVTAPLTQKEMHKREFESRDELDYEEVKDLLVQIRSRL